MLTDLMMRIFDRKYLLAWEVLFGFTDGEDNCHVELKQYNLDGSFQRYINPSEFINDAAFWFYGGAMVIWLSLISNLLIDTGNVKVLKKMIGLCNVLFHVKQFKISNISDVINSKAKLQAVTNNSTVQVKINLQAKMLLVRATNLPFGDYAESEIYLFLILYNFYCKIYPNAFKLLGDGCCDFMEILKKNNYSKQKSYLIAANKINEEIMKRLLKKEGVDFDLLFI